MRKVVLTFLILAGAFPCFAKYSGGTGDANTPYQIANAADLLTLANDANDYNKCFILTADIDLGAYGVFTTAVIAPQGSGTFSGVFNGASHKITNLTINTGGSRKDYLGLFGSIGGGVIKNLGLENVSITDGDNATYIGGLVGYSNGNIINCYATVVISGGDLVMCFGGLIGESHGNISSCYSAATIYGGFGAHLLGGLTGNNYASINRSYSIGYIGCGYGSMYLGGLTGSDQNTISNCYSTCSVSGGMASGYLGGLVGYDIGGNIGNCYSAGSVYCPTSSSSIGGFLGKNVAPPRGNIGIISNCYFLVTAGPSNGYGTPLTAAQMKHQSSFAGWNFVNVWFINEGVSYPQLIWPAQVPSYSGGSGTADDPYHIATVSDLLVLKWYDYDYDKHFILMNDLDLDPNISGNRVFTTAIIAQDTVSGTSVYEGSPFTGVFDGAGHKISNLTINTNGTVNDYLGLFGYVSGEIKNLRLENIYINGGGSTYLGGLVGYNDGVIIDCCSTGIVVAGNYLGGLVGSSRSHGNISNCYSMGLVNGTESVGGLVGSNSGTISYCSSVVDVAGVSDIGGLIGGNSGSIHICLSTGNVIGGDGSYTVGGLAGYNSNGSIDNCYSAGTVSGGNNSSGLGGLIGFSDGSISKCYSTGNITGGDGAFGVGGLAGYNEGSMDNCYSTGRVSGGASSYGLGGLIGYIDSGGISKCYSTGIVIGGDGSDFIGGLTGGNMDSIAVTIINSYFLSTAGPDNGYGTPLTDEQMKQQASFVGWDYNDVWAICEGTNYPRLQFQIPAADLVCPDGVNFVDFAYLAERWLWTDCGDCSGADMTGDGIVDLLDIALFAENWLMGF
ncbi:MAG: GLUG motif-containing protein [Sedimentisphaerales bacterium]|jgi:hypothetical protein